MAITERVLPANARAVRQDLATISGNVTKGDWLSTGDKGKDVEALQRRLQALGHYNGPVNGTFDAATDKAVRAFQRANDETVDGKVGPQTLKALKSSVKFVKDHFEGDTGTRGEAGKDILGVEKRLKALGYDTGRVDGVFDAKTAAAVKSYRKRDANLRDERNDITKAFEREVNKADAPKAPREPAPTKGDRVQDKLEEFNRKPPRADYDRTTFRGATMNERTKEMLERAEYIMRNKLGHKDFKFSISQGSYNDSVSASAGTHDGGGALDIRTSMYGTKMRKDMSQALRMAGFAAWNRGMGQDSFPPHIHAIAMGDRQASTIAKNQVREYLAGGDGLVGNRPDPDRDVGRPVPRWAR